MRVLALAFGIALAVPSVAGATCIPLSGGGPHQRRWVDIAFALPSHGTANWDLSYYVDHCPGTDYGLSYELRPAYAPHEWPRLHIARGRFSLRQSRVFPSLKTRYVLQGHRVGSRYVGTFRAVDTETYGGTPATPGSCTGPPSAGRSIPLDDAENRPRNALSPRTRGPAGTWQTGLSHLPQRPSSPFLRDRVRLPVQTLDQLEHQVTGMNDQKSGDPDFLSKKHVPVRS